MITVVAYRFVPPMVQGLVRDIRVRWALEELGLPYQVKLVDHADRKSAEHRKLQPFGQVPAYIEDDLQLFESGAIVLHIAEKSELLLPRDPTARAHVIQWVFAALNSVEWTFQNLLMIDLGNANTAWGEERRPATLALVEERLAVLEEILRDREYLEGAFSVADLQMSSVLRMLRHTDLVANYPAVEAYHRRCEARPAFVRALDGQMTVFKEAATA